MEIEGEVVGGRKGKTTILFFSIFWVLVVNSHALANKAANKAGKEDLKSRQRIRREIAFLFFTWYKSRFLPLEVCFNPRSLPSSIGKWSKINNWSGDSLSEKKRLRDEMWRLWWEIRWQTYFVLLMLLLSLFQQVKET